MIILSIDPGATSGIAVFNTESKDILLAETYEAMQPDYDRKIRWLAGALEEVLAEFKPGEIETAFIETFVLHGVSGKQLQKLVGAFVSRIPDDIEIRHVMNTTVKLVAGGNGDADKSQVAYGVWEYFKRNSVSADYIKTLIQKEKWDLTDAFAVGIAGVNSAPPKKRKKKNVRSSKA